MGCCCSSSDQIYNAESIYSYEEEDICYESNNYIPFSEFILKDNPTLNGYCFLHEIGRGAMSRVFKAVSTETDEIFAAKIYNNSQICRATLACEPPYIAIQRELDLMAKLNHRYVLSFIDAFNDEITNSLVIILCYAPLGNLKSLLDDKKVDKEQLNTCFYQIATAMDYLHSKNIIHRDIKPENILSIDKDYYVISDLSVSQELESSDQKVIDTKGSPAFMSPEECKGDEFSPKPADVWSYGVSMYNAYYGILPFDLDNCVSGSIVSSLIMIADHLNNDEVEFPNNDDEDLNNLLKRILNKDPMKRPTFKEIAEDPYFENAKLADNLLLEEEEEEEEEKSEK